MGGGGGGNTLALAGADLLRGGLLERRPPRLRWSPSVSCQSCCCSWRFWLLRSSLPSRSAACHVCGWSAGAAAGTGTCGVWAALVFSESELGGVTKVSSASGLGIALAGSEAAALVDATAVVVVWYSVDAVAAVSCGVG